MRERIPQLKLAYIYGIRITRIGTGMIDGDLELVLVERKPVSDPDSGIPGYSFLMRNPASGAEMGRIKLRAGYTENIRLYRGNIGFTVFEAFRGHRYSARSCGLLAPLIKSLDLDPIWLTCNVDNPGSRKIIESIGAEYVDTTVIPDGSALIRYYPEGARRKLRFIWRPSR
jgi:predicted acetyltransferase